MGKYQVECLDAVYDDENGFLVLNLFFLDMQEKRIVTWHRDDFTFKGKKGVPDIEMLRTARMIKGKRFHIVIEDDPNRELLDENRQMYYASLFNKRINDELEKVSGGLSDDQWQIDRKLDRMKQEGKLGNR